MNVSNLIAQSLLGKRSDAIIAADHDGIVCFWNPGAERVFGYSRGEAIGRSLDLIVPERLRDRHWDGYRTTIATGKSRYGTAMCFQFQPFIRTERLSQLSLPLYR
jgi:PAS domain S-box-containing protein